VSLRDVITQIQAADAALELLGPAPFHVSIRGIEAVVAGAGRRDAPDDARTTYLTTQQAADYLNVSRPFLIALLEEKKLPFRLVGSHRRIRFADLQAFREADDKKREAVLAELAADAQLNGHGY
jgi:excisionase family DNA binding protein